MSGGDRARVGQGLGRALRRPWKLTQAARLSIDAFAERYAQRRGLGAGCTERLRGPTADSPWDPQLAARMAQTGRAVMEERLIPELLRDLSAAGDPTVSTAG
jgi:hypothetical protein